MQLGQRLQQWWERVRGLDEEPATASRPEPRAIRRKPAARAIRPLSSLPASGDLQFSVEGEPAGLDGRQASLGAVGFDPYASDGGYRKPRGWDDVHRK